MARGALAGRPTERRRLRTLLIVLAVVTLAGALLLGVASASGPGGPGAATATATATATGGAGGRALPGLRARWRAWLEARGEVTARPLARRPLHALLLARLLGAGNRTQPAGRVVLGRLLDLSESTATLATAGGQPVTVRVTPETPAAPAPAAGGGRGAGGGAARGGRELGGPGGAAAPGRALAGCGAGCGQRCGQRCDQSSKPSSWGA